MTKAERKQKIKETYARYVAVERAFQAAGSPAGGPAWRAVLRAKAEYLQAIKTKE